jgi:hypothetical protein
MPGLPRKSTVKQFRKLMKKSGKFKTNKKVGGIDPSKRKIDTYEQYLLMRETINISDIDPYGEEDWEEDWREKVRGIFNFLQEQTGKECADLKYVLIFLDYDIIGIELLKEDENDELVEDEDFFFSLYFENKYGGMINKYKDKSDREKFWYPVSVDDKNFILNYLRKVLEYIKFHQKYIS